ncbi:WSC domain-containing protein [Xylaria bambusicola]|uniref:WSC domain-containing protein n=1 Tax=Xylaria bambusicola TaxID=326684 RepID=UPI0020081C62|nr:WSC domain-containing protein [Xylaria bambusicola]KAI0506114.1 WSC domain-containing protein [Xylaria bambusicola]
MLRGYPLPLLSLLLITPPILPHVAAQSSNNTLTIVDGSASDYVYIGCWNETSALPGTTGLRALDGASETLPEEMTVERCLHFCAHDRPSRPYQLAGLEYSRECWCGDELNSLSERLSDGACDTSCDGANTTACGGALRLSLYNSTFVDANDKSGAGELRADGAWKGAVFGAVVLTLGFAFAG